MGQVEKKWSDRTQMLCTDIVHHSVRIGVSFQHVNNHIYLKRQTYGARGV